MLGALGLHRIELDTWSGNDRALRAFAKAGFREEGRRRSTLLVAGKRYCSMRAWARPAAPKPGPGSPSFTPPPPRPPHVVCGAGAAVCPACTGWFYGWVK
ncbi:GNAT family N-acetyltransferase [Streptomyces sp. NPDC090045]|uniref:GNAT family N-acetyltransferase n=1 Tax=Streptomyces sp. NPDC090045 TaxID=3365927 RepID=UPI0038162808